MDKKILLKEIGDNLRIERLRLRLSQEELADMAGLSTPNHVGKIERAEINPTITTIIALLKALNMSFDKLYDLK